MSRFCFFRHCAHTKSFLFCLTQKFKQFLSAGTRLHIYILQRLNNCCNLILPEFLYIPGYRHVRYGIFAAKYRLLHSLLHNVLHSFFHSLSHNLLHSFFRSFFRSFRQNYPYLFLFCFFAFLFLYARFQF